jgi:hypothetical protein
MLDRSSPARTRYAGSSAPVTVGEFQRFLKENELEKWFDGGGQAAFP